MAIQTINIGSSANKGDGDPLRTAFKKINENFAELDPTNTIRDIKGSVFGDDSTLLVDGVNSLIPSSVLSGNLPAIDGSALTGITVSSVAFSNVTSKPTTIAGYGITDALTSVPAQTFASLTGKPTTIAGYGITDALALGTSSTTALAGDTALFSGAFADLTSKPSTLAGYGITDGAGLADVISDTSPQLGGGLDVQTFQIVSTTGNDIHLAPASGQQVVIGGTATDGTANRHLQFSNPSTANQTQTAGGSVDFSVRDLTQAGISDYARITGWAHGEGQPLSASNDGSGLLEFYVRSDDYGAAGLYRMLYVDNGGLKVARGSLGFDAGTSINFDNATITNLDFSDIASKPSTISGYGITDAYTKTEVDNLTTTLDGDLTGSVFGDDSTLLVDGNNNKIVGAVDTTSLRTSDETIALGSQAGRTSQSNSAVAIGNLAGVTTQGASSIAIGPQAGMSDQGDRAVAIGSAGGATTQGEKAVAIGFTAGQTTQGANAVAIGNMAGVTSQGAAAVAIGEEAGKTTQGSDAIAIGEQAGEVNQGADGIAIGDEAGQTNQGAESVAIGFLAGETTQAASSIAIGSKAGNTDQLGGSVAIGFQAGFTTQAEEAVAIGYQAGETNQAASSIAIGDEAGQTNQGGNTIAIGERAGHANQHANTIVINAQTETALDTTQTGEFLVKPVRQVSGGTLPTGFKTVGYNPTTGEFIYLAGV